MTVGQTTLVRRGRRGSARVDVPARADDDDDDDDDDVIVEDAVSERSVRFSLEGMQATPVAVEHGLAIGPGALSGADVVHRVQAEGIEYAAVRHRRRGCTARRRARGLGMRVRPRSLRPVGSSGHETGRAALLRARVLVGRDMPGDGRPRVVDDGIDGATALSPCRDAARVGTRADRARRVER